MTEAILTRAQVAFHTNNDDKDHDTKLFTTLRDNTGNVVAQLDEHFGDDTWHDNEDDGPYELRRVAGASWSSMRHGRLNIRIEPNGNDTWNFNVEAILFFSDGERRRADGRNLSLSQDRQQIDVEIL